MALLFAAGDVRMLARGGVSDAQRIARHLVRMCFALFIATGSLFLARPHLFPALLRKTHILFLLGILPLILMVFWLFRVLFTKAYEKTSGPRNAMLTRFEPGLRVHLVATRRGGQGVAALRGKAVEAHHARLI